MSDTKESSFKSALLNLAGGLSDNPVIGPMIEDIAYDFISSPECRDAFMAYAKRRIKEKTGLADK